MTAFARRRISSNGLRKDGVLTGPPFSQPIDFVYFDLWHYDGRTSKHGAFMGGADFVQWHGNYPMLQKTVELNPWPPSLGESMAEANERWWAKSAALDRSVRDR